MVQAQIETLRFLRTVTGHTVISQAFEQRSPHPLGDGRPMVEA
jgi:hypothetical protein